MTTIENKPTTFKISLHRCILLFRKLVFELDLVNSTPYQVLGCGKKKKSKIFTLTLIFAGKITKYFIITIIVK